PDHGTAYDIAGKGLADFNSFKEAVYLAIDVFHSRNQHLEISANPMKIREIKEEKNIR
ncbi:MAG: 4-hydroxythreonine-4-phosphate dehydrogenase PdxA, partial [Flavobacterium sp.]|nr:4-hydroxythreonine-4-phosphate dehydrogenase PdxA [Flavobacterium sp.]